MLLNGVARRALRVQASRRGDDEAGRREHRDAEQRDAECVQAAKVGSPGVARRQRVDRYADARPKCVDPLADHESPHARAADEKTGAGPLPRRSVSAEMDDVVQVRRLWTGGPAGGEYRGGCQL